MTNRKTALQDMPGEIFARIDSRGSEWCLNPIYGTRYIRADLAPRHTITVTDEMVELAEVVWDKHDMRKALEAAFSLVRETQPVQPDPLAGSPDGLVG